MKISINIKQQSNVDHAHGNNNRISFLSLRLVKIVMSNKKMGETGVLAPNVVTWKYFIFM